MFYDLMSWFLHDFFQMTKNHPFILTVSIWRFSIFARLGMAKHHLSCSERWWGTSYPSCCWRNRASGGATSHGGLTNSTYPRNQSTSMFCWCRPFGCSKTTPCPMLFELWRPWVWCYLGRISSKTSAECKGRISSCRWSPVWSGSNQQRYRW